MKNLVALAFILGLSGSAAQAVPLSPGEISTGMVITVAEGCGRGFHRAPNGNCYRNEGVVVVPGAVVVEPGGPCGGRGRHRVCFPDGRCEMVCN